MADESLSTSRLEAFSDGVIAVIITIMVLELKVPEAAKPNLQALHEVALPLAVYLLSFVQVGIYWVNHHYMIDSVKRVTHGLLWSNLIFLFTLSLFPFATYWVRERGVSPFSIALYAVCSVLPAFAWAVEANFISSAQGSMDDTGGRTKQVVSTLLYLGAIPCAYLSPWLAVAMISAVAVMWLVPPRSVRDKTPAARHGNPE